MLCHIASGATPGPSAVARYWVALGGADFRLLVAQGQVLDTDELPGLEMPYGFFRPDSGLRRCADAWLRSGGPHHQVLNLGRRAEEWHLFGEAAGIEVVLV